MSYSQLLALSEDLPLHLTAQALLRPPISGGPILDFTADAAGQLPARFYRPATIGL